MPSPDARPLAPRPTPEGPAPKVLTLLTARSPTLVPFDASGPAAPLEVVRCRTAADLHAQLRWCGPYAAALLDARHPDLDRDLLARLADRATPALVVAEHPGSTDWVALGARAVLAGGTGPALLDVVRAWLDGASSPGPRTRGVARLAPGAATTVAVLGAPGQGTSTVAAALAAGLAAPPSGPGSWPVETAPAPVVLADLGRHAEQAALHRLPAGAPGLLDLVDAHRHARPSPADALAHCRARHPHRHRVLPGLAHPGDWACIGPESLDAALSSLRAAAGWLVLDVDADLDDEATTGSHDIEDRNRLALAAVSTAELVLIVGRPSSLGQRRLAPILADLIRVGVPRSRLLLVGAAGRRTATDLRSAPAPAPAHGLLDLPALALPWVDGLEDGMLSGGGVPAALSTPLAAFVRMTAAALGRRTRQVLAPPTVVAGTLGHWPVAP